MKIENMSLAILSYFETALMPQIPTSLGKALSYGGLLLKMPELENTMKKYSSMIVDETGNLDLNKMHTIGSQVFDKIPKIEIADWDFDRNDFEAFISYLSTQG